VENCLNSRSVCAGLLIFCAHLYSAAQAQDWPCYRGPNGDGIVTESGLLLDWPATGLKQLWSVSLHDDEKSSHGGPSIAGGKVYLPYRAGATDVIVCLSATDGKEVWRYAYDVPTKVETYGTGIRTNPTVYGKFVYTLGCYGQLYCLDSDTGAPVWKHDLIKDFDGHAPMFGDSASPIIMNGMLICETGGQGKAVVALDPATGNTIWESGNDGASYATPQKITIDGVDQVLAYMDSGLVAYDLKDGKELWRFDYQEERRKNIPQPIAIGDMIYLTNNTLGFSAIKVKHHENTWDVERIWSVRKEKLHYSSPVKGDGCLYYQNSKRELKCMDLATGNVAWAAQNVGQQFATLLRLGDNHLIAALDDGQLVLMEVSPTAYHEKARFPAVEKTFVQPSISDRKLFLRDHERLVCFDLSSEKKPELAAAETTAPTAPTPPRASAHTHRSIAFDPSASAIANFKASWSFRHNAYYGTWLAAFCLALIGVWAASRGERVEAVVVCEAAVAGSLLAMCLSSVTLSHIEFLKSSRFMEIVPLVLAVAGALVCGFGRITPRISSSGAAGGKRAWLSAAGFAAAFFVLSRIPLSSIDATSVLLTTDFNDTRSEVSNLLHISEVSLLLVAVAFSAWGKKSHWIVRLIFQIWFAVALGFCAQSAGAIFAFACVFFAPLFAGIIAEKSLPRVIIAVTLAVLATTAGWIIAQTHHSYSFAVPAALIMASAALVAAGIRAFLKRDFKTIKTPDAVQAQP
jgi:outer membrane protein assembly factor BamB